MFLAGRNVLASAAVVLGLVGAAHSQDAFPSKPITIVMPLPAGASPDLRTRLIAEHWSKTLGQAVVVQNTPGAGGVPGVKSVLGAAPDGYTLLAAPSSIFTILPVQNKELGFDVSRDLTPVGQIAGEPMIIAVSSKSSVKDLAGLISEAKARPNALVIGTNPEGTLPFLAGKLLANRSGAPIEVRPYSGGTKEAVGDIREGRAHAVIEAYGPLRPSFASKDLKPIAVLSAERVATLPDVPTAAGTIKGLTAVGWVGVFAPSGAPAAHVDRLTQSLRLTLAKPEVKSALDKTGTPFEPRFGQELGDFIREDQAMWKPVVSAR